MALPPPHGGILVDRKLRGVKREAALERALELKRIQLNSVNCSDLEMIANGAFSPLTGFMGQADHERVRRAGDPHAAGLASLFEDYVV